MFVADGTRPVFMRPAFRFMTVRRHFLIAFEPIWAFPAKFFTKVTIKITQAVISRGDALIAARHALFARKMNVLVLLIGFKCRSGCIIETVGVRPKPTNIESPHALLRASIHDP